MYHDGMRELQDRYGGRKVADRIEEHRKHREFTSEDKTFVETVPFFFLATAWQDNVDCSIKSGYPGFVCVSAPRELSWPDYDGNRMYRSLGNIVRNPNVGLLFIHFDATSTRLRVTGKARIVEDEAEFRHLPGALRLIRVSVDYIYYNCPRSVPKMEFVEPSIYTPRKGYTPPEPEWKSRDYIRDVLDD
jgi:predicted pyridoxine 5'-phosphate oxidase superfamily flavin-nucleotide-binding protein